MIDPIDKVKPLFQIFPYGSYGRMRDNEKSDFFIECTPFMGLFIHVGGKIGWEYKVNFKPRLTMALVITFNRYETYVKYDPRIFSIVNPHNLRCHATWYYIVRKVLEGSGEKWGMECFK